MHVTIERMRLSDLNDVVRMERRSFPTPWQPETFRYEITSNPTGYYVVARLHLPEGTRAVGYAGMWLVMDEAHITTIGVDPDYRGLHIGERLLAHLLETTMRHGGTRITLEVRESNLVAQRLYRKYCFDAVGMRRGYYTDTGENAIVMWIENLNDPQFQRVFREHQEQLERQEHAPSRR